MKQRILMHSGVLALVGLLLASTAHAFDFGNMMSPNKWMNNNDDDDYYEDDYYRGYGPYGPPPPYYGGAPGYPPPGYGAPGYGVPGYGAPGYAAPGYGGGYTTPAPAAAQSYGPDHDMPDTHSSYEYNRDQEEITRLKDRIRALEQSQQPPSYGSQQATPYTPPPQPSWGNQPAYQQSQPGWDNQPTHQQSQPATQTTQPGWSNQPPYKYREEE